MLLAEHPRAVEEILVGAGLLERAAELCGEFFRLGQRAKERGIDQPVHGLGIVRNHIGEARRGAQRERAVATRARNLPRAGGCPRSSALTRT